MANSEVVRNLGFYDLNEVNRLNEVEGRGDTSKEHYVKEVEAAVGSIALCPVAQCEGCEGYFGGANGNKPKCAKYERLTAALEDVDVDISDLWSGEEEGGAA